MTGHTLIQHTYIPLIIPMHRFALTIMSLLCCTMLSAQLSRLGKDIEYEATLNGQFGDGEHAPFWQTANRFGLASTKNNSGYLRAAIRRDSEADSLRKWRIGYGADMAVPFGWDSKFVLQQLYAEFAYLKVRLSIGQKERHSELKNDALTSGSMVLGTNARPLPQVRLETSDFFAIPGTRHWVSLKGHAAYGWYTDNRWQRDFNHGVKGAIFTANSLYHSKAGYMRVGNPDKFPLVFTGGAEMVCQFGGTVWNRGITNRPDGGYDMPAGLKEYCQAFIPTGSDVTDGDNPNVMGNQVGSYQVRLDYHGHGWIASLYGEHFFEDHSMMGWDFDWKDFLWGAEVKLPKNPFLSTIVLEHQRTTDQSGAVFVNTSQHIRPIGGVDNYYHHGLYGSYQHAGFMMGTPLILSPIYRTDGHLEPTDSRLTAHHIGLSGNPHPDVSYRILYTYEKSLGTYPQPRQSPTTGQFLLVESSYRPHQVKGLSFTASYGQNMGELLGSSKGGMLSVGYSGWIK